MGDVVNLHPTDLEYAEQQLEECVRNMAMGDTDEAVNHLYAAVSALKRVIEEQVRDGG